MYAQYDAKITFPGNEPGLQEELMTSMEISTAGEAEERITALEKRVRDMEALVKGLTAELLDLKTVSRGMSRQDGERSRQEIKKGTVVRGTTPTVPAGPSASPSVVVSSDDRVVIRPKGESQQDAPAEPAMARIMQADGTMKMEPRYGDQKTTNSSSGDGRTRKGSSARNR